VQIRVATETDADVVADLAAVTFPLACPPSVAAADIEAGIAAALTPRHFRQHLAARDRLVLTAAEADRVVGYTMLILGIGSDPDVARCIERRPAVELSKMPAVELSKMYVLPDWHRSGAAAALMETGITWAVDQGARAVWLGVNQANHRAQGFYRKHGFEVVGTRRFALGVSLQDDFVMVRTL